MRYVFIVLIAIFGLLAAVLLPEMKIITEYRNGKWKIAFRSLLFRFTFDSDKLQRLAEKRRKKETPRNRNDGGADADKTEPHGTETKTADGEAQVGGEDKEKSESDSFFGKILELKKSWQEQKSVIDAFVRSTKHKIRFSDIYVRVRYGTGDAAATGMIYGAVWSLVGTVYAFLCRSFYIGFPDIELEPVYDKKVFSCEAEGIITVRPVHIIIAAFRGFKIYLKNKKEREKRSV